ncbi:MAG: hypothetical protein H7Z39_16340 [Burkholderiaceae bacterium]|nr:hypothetical protein [Burkholderiaceae bacterium]
MTSLLQHHQRRAADLALSLLMLRLGAGVRIAKPRRDAFDYRGTPSTVGDPRNLPGCGR